MSLSPVKFEREFLRMAACFLSCRLEVMGGYVLKGWERPTDQATALSYSLLGEVDNAVEMRLMCAESAGPNHNE